LVRAAAKHGVLVYHATMEFRQVDQDDFTKGVEIRVKKNAKNMSNQHLLVNEVPGVAAAAGKKLDDAIVEKTGITPKYQYGPLKPNTESTGVIVK
jgi:hypothetical protein